MREEQVSGQPISALVGCCVPELVPAHYALAGYLIFLTSLARDPRRWGVEPGHLRAIVTQRGRAWFTRMLQRAQRAEQAGELGEQALLAAEQFKRAHAEEGVTIRLLEVQDASLMIATGDAAASSRVSRETVVRVVAVLAEHGYSVTPDALVGRAVGAIARDLEPDDQVMQRRLIEGLAFLEAAHAWSDQRRNQLARELGLEG